MSELSFGQLVVRLTVGIALGLIVAFVGVAYQADATRDPEQLKERERAFVTCVEAVDFETCSTLRGQR